MDALRSHPSRAAAMDGAPERSSRDRKFGQRRWPEDGGLVFVEVPVSGAKRDTRISTVDHFAYRLKDGDWIIRMNEDVVLSHSEVVSVEMRTIGKTSFDRQFEIREFVEVIERACSELKDELVCPFQEYSGFTITFMSRPQVLRPRLVQSAAPNFAQDDGAFGGSRDRRSTADPPTASKDDKA